MHEYKKEEQPDTDFNLDERVKLYGNADITKYHDIVVEFDAQKLNPKNFQVIVSISELLQDSGEVGEMEYEIFKFYIKSLDTYEEELIVCES